MVGSTEVDMYKMSVIEHISQKIIWQMLSVCPMSSYKEAKPSSPTRYLLLNSSNSGRGTEGLGCAFRFVFRFLPGLIFRNSGNSAEFPEFRGTHVGIKSFQGKINLLRNSGSGIPDPEFRREGPLTWCILCHV